MNGIIGENSMGDASYRGEKPASKNLGQKVKLSFLSVKMNKQINERKTAGEKFHNRTLFSEKHPLKIFLLIGRAQSRTAC